MSDYITRVDALAAVYDEARQLGFDDVTVGRFLSAIYDITNHIEITHCSNCSKRNTLLCSMYRRATDNDFCSKARTRI